MISHYQIQKKYFEIQYRELLRQMFNEFNEQYKKYDLEYHDKKKLNYDSFVSYCFSISK